VRRRLVEQGVSLMRRLHMINATVSAQGIVFGAGEEASAFVDSLRSFYARELKRRAAWLAEYLAEKSDDAMAAPIAERIGRWAVEFQGEVGPTGSSP
jgi:hypothetical protein